MGLFEDLNSAGLRAIGLNPEWVDLAQTDIAGAPNSASDGVSLQTSPSAMVYVAPRERVSARTSRIVITVGDVATTYTATVNGNDVNTVPSAPALATVADELKDDINADGTVGPLVTATIDLAGDPSGATIRLVGRAEPDYSIDASVAAGTGDLTFNADAGSFDLRIYGTPGGQIDSASTGNTQKWVQVLDGYYPANDYRGFVERFDVAGMERLYPELENVAGHGSDGSSVTLNISTMVGPAVIEAA